VVATPPANVLSQYLTAVSAQDATAAWALLCLSVQRGTTETAYGALVRQASEGLGGVRHFSISPSAAAAGTSTTLSYTIDASVGAIGPIFATLTKVTTGWAICGFSLRSPSLCSAMTAAATPVGPRPIGSGFAPPVSALLDVVIPVPGPGYRLVSETPEDRATAISEGTPASIVDATGFVGGFLKRWSSANLGVLDDAKEFNASPPAPSASPSAMVQCPRATDLFNVAGVPGSIGFEVPNLVATGLQDGSHGPTTDWVYFLVGRVGFTIAATSSQPPTDHALVNQIAEAQYRWALGYPTKPNP